MSIDEIVVKMARAAKIAAGKMAVCPAVEKKNILFKIAEKICKQSSYIKHENEKDLERANKMKLSNAMIDRLIISDATIKSMTDGLKEVGQLNDPVGTLSETAIRPNGLQVARMRIPLGVIGIIYESRPNVTVDAAALCLKAGNAVILRGGSEAFYSNQALSHIIGNAFIEEGLPKDAVQVVPVRDRSAVNVLLQQDEYIDLIIPRGGEGLIRFVVENSKIPVLKHYKGVCHVYIDAGADFNMAEQICFNSKVQRPGVCNAVETILIHRSVAQDFLPGLTKMFVRSGVQIRGCSEVCLIVPEAKEAIEEDWPAEFLDLIVAVKVVENMDHAMEHIKKYGSNHTESIVTSDYGRGRRFVREVDSSVVFVNASTRFSDGNQLGLGAEIGISTSKLHAFGPMGVEELTTSKFVVYGDGQIRD